MRYQVFNGYVGTIIVSIVAVGVGIAAYKQIKSFIDNKNKNKNKINPDEKSFPLLEGKPVEYAVDYLKTYYPHLNCYPINQNSARIMDLNLERVWLNHDDNNIVVGIPKIE